MGRKIHISLLLDSLAMGLHIALLVFIFSLAHARPVEFSDIRFRQLNTSFKPSFTPSPTFINASQASGFHVDVPTPTTGCVEAALPGHWQCDYNWPTMDQIFYWMDPANGGGVTSTRVPLFYYGWRERTAAAIGWGTAYLQSLISGPVDCYYYETGLAMKADNKELITGQQVTDFTDGW